MWFTDKETSHESAQKVMSLVVAADYFPRETPGRLSSDPIAPWLDGANHRLTSEGN